MKPPVYLLILLLAGAACTDAITPDIVTVDVADDQFLPANVNIDVGQTVTWEWIGSNQHDVRWSAGTPAGQDAQTTGTYSRTFATTGTHGYYCTIHGTPTSGMRGTVTVN